MGKYHQSICQKGFSLIEIMLVISIISFAFIGIVAYSIKMAERARAEVAGEQFSEIGKALSMYINLESSNLSSCISPNSTIDSIPLNVLKTSTGTTIVDTCSLKNRQILPRTFSEANIFGTGYNVGIQKNSSHILGGLVISLDSITDPSFPDSIKYDWIAIAMKKAGAQSGMTFTVTGENSLRGLGGGWTLSDTDFAGINKLGLLGYRVGFQSNYDDVYLRLDGAYPMRGNFNMGNYNINNATDINFNGWLNGNNALLNNLKTGYISNSGNIQTNTLTSTNDIKSDTNIRADVDIRAGRDVSSGRDLLSGRDVRAVRDVNAFNSVIGNNNVIAGNNVVAGNMITAYSDIVGNGNIYSNQNIVAQGMFQVGAIVIEGTACGQNGSIGRKSTGGTLSCDSGVWSGTSNADLGTLCGSGFTGSRYSGNVAYCKGYNPASSCPTGYTRRLIFEADDVFQYSCVRQ